MKNSNLFQSFDVGYARLRKLTQKSNQNDRVKIEHTKKKN